MQLNSATSPCDLTIPLKGGGSATYHCVLHNENGPAITRPGGEQWWYLNGQLHRVGGPAVIIPNRVQYWYLNGNFHNDNGPAIMYSDGATEYYQHGTKINP